jgi:hypothetical protein
MNADENKGHFLIGVDLRLSAASNVSWLDPGGLGRHE